MNLTKRVTILLVLGLAVALPALSAPRKTEEVDIDVEERKRPRGQQAAEVETRITRNEAFLIATETRLKKEIERAIRYLSRTAGTMPRKSTARMEMREKIVNLRMELAVFHANEEMRTYDRQWERWNANGKRGAEPKLNSSRSRQEWATLANDAQTLLSEFPRSKNADTTMFNMGLAKSFLGREKDAARIFSQLIAKYPNSEKAGDAYFALGDFYFDRADFRNASNNYKNALKFKRSKAYAWSLFKLGWCSYNLGNYKQGLAYWKQTVLAANQAGKKGLALKEEALRDMVYAFAELSQVEPAIAYYRRNGGQKYIGKFLILLSSTFSYQGRYAAAIKVLKRFQQVAPNDEAAPDTQKEIINLNYEIGRLKAVWAELSRFPKMYGPRSSWASRNSGNRQLVVETQAMIKDQILYYAKLTHKRAQKDDNARLGLEAMKGYQLFLANYPKSKEVAEVKYNMADIQYFAKNYRAAGKLYYEIAMMGKGKAVIYNPKTKKSRDIHKESANYMLDAYLQDFEPEFNALIKRKPDFKKPPRKLSLRARNFVRACGNYRKWYENDQKNVKTCDVFITEIYYRSNDKKNAMKWLWVLAKKYPGTKEGNEAVENLIPMYKGDDTGLLRASQELLKIPAYAKGKIGKKLRDLEVNLALGAIQKIKKPCDRVKATESFVKNNPRHPEVDKLIYNSANDSIKCGNIGKAIASFQTVLKRYPKSEGAKDSLKQVGQLSEARLDLSQAAGYYLQYSKKYPKDPFAIAALANACKLQAALEMGSAVQTCLAFAQRDQASAKVEFERMMRAARSARENGRLAQITQVYLGKFRLSAAEKILAYSRIYDAAGGSGGAASNAATNIMNEFKRAGGNVDGEALRAVGQLVFKRVNPIMQRYEKLKLRGGTVDALAASIQQKAGFINELQGSYEQVLKTQDAYWGVAALYQLGYARQLLSEDLEKPPEIRGARYSEVVQQLAGDAKAAKAEARQFFTKALSSVSQFKVYNIWAARALAGLARIQGRDVSFDDIIVTPDFLGAEVSATVADAVGGT